MPCKDEESGKDATSQPPPRMNEKQAAAHLGIRPGTLAVWRCVGRYNLPFIKVGRSVRYDRVALDLWLEQRRVGAALVHPGREMRGDS